MDTKMNVSEQCALAAKGATRVLQEEVLSREVITESGVSCPVLGHQLKKDVDLLGRV